MPDAVWLFVYLFWRIQIAPVICLFGIAQNKYTNSIFYLFVYAGKTNSRIWPEINIEII